MSNKTKKDIYYITRVDTENATRSFMCTDVYVATINVIYNATMSATRNATVGAIDRELEHVK